MIERQPVRAHPEHLVPVEAHSRAPNVRKFTCTTTLPDSTVRLLEREGRSRFFNGWSWYCTYCETCLDAPYMPIFYVASAEGPAELILPMQTPLGRLGSNVSGRPLGPMTRMSMTNYQTAYFGPVCDADHDAAAPLANALFRRLRDEGCSVMDFNHLDCAIPANRLLRPALEAAGFLVHPYMDEPIVFEDIGGRSYAEFVQGLSSNLRGNIKRRTKRMRQAGRVRFDLVTGGADLDRRIQDYQTVQQASWKPAEAYPDHVPALIRTAAEAGALRLGLLYLDDRPLATDLTIVAGGRATSKKAHYDLAARGYHAGDVLTAMMFEHLIDVDRVATVDFGKTALPYKLKWLRQQRPMHGLVAFNPQTFDGHMHRMLYRSRHLAREQIQQIKGWLVRRQKPSGEEPRADQP